MRPEEPASQAGSGDARLLELLNQTGKLISSQLDLHALVQAVTDVATELSGAKFGAFFHNVLNEHGEALLLYTLSGVSQKAFERFGVPRNTPLFKRTFRGEGVVRCADVTVEPVYGRMSPHHGMPKGHLPVRSYLAVPVVSRSGDVIGGLFFGHPEPNVFTERTERLIVSIAAQAAVGIDNARLYDEVKRLAEERSALLAAERAARAEAQRISFLKDEFIANISHELRTPLNAILGWADVLADTRPDGDALWQGIETIARNARAQARLIDDLLDMNRIVSGKVRLDLQETNLALVIEQAVATARPSADAKGLSIHTDIDQELTPVLGDPNRLQQIVTNLLSNAVKFTPRGGLIEVTLGKVNSHAEIAVRDSGIGISAEFLPHLFERFRQADPSLVRAHGGLGLGLSIVKQLAMLHGGSVRAESGGPNQGATFVVHLPLVMANRPGVEAEEATSERSRALALAEIDLSGVRVLVVEDEDDARELLRRVLAQYRAEVVTAGMAEEGFELLRQCKPDVLVSDISMPVVDGYQLIRRIRRLPVEEGGGTPAIALTAFARSEDRTRAMMAGYQMHITKPIEPQELIATVASFVGRTARSERVPR